MVVARWIDHSSAWALWREYGKVAVWIARGLHLFP